MKQLSIICLVFLVLFLAGRPAAEAKAAEARSGMFDQSGRRERQGVSDLRSRLRAGETPGAVVEGAGEITGDERFLRESRDATDFVGAATGEERGFVGAQTGNTDGEIRSAIEGDLVREAVEPMINRIRSLPQLQTGMYAPRLKLGFVPVTLPGPTEVEAVATERLSLSSAIQPTRPFEVSLEGRTARLRGAVASEHEKRLAGLMLLFEPGISKVENELAVLPPVLLPPPMDSRPSPLPEPLLEPEPRGSSSAPD